MQADEKKIVMLGTGGTIAGTASTPQDTLGYRAAQRTVGELLEAAPALGGRPIITEQVAQIDSKDMDFALWRQLALRCAHWLAQADVQGLVVTHGTDTLEETAFFLQSVLAPDKPVVLTGAMRPATALAPDGPQNLVDAVTVANFEGARGVVAVCAGMVHSAVDVAKAHPWRLDAFTSGDAGPLGYVEAGALRMLRNWPAADAAAGPAVMKKIADARHWPRVEIVMSYAGADGAVVRALQDQGVEGLVVAGTGNGTLTTSLEQALLAAQAAGVRVLRATRCASGRVLAHPGDVLSDSGGLSAVKARVALMLELLP